MPRLPKSDAPPPPRGDLPSMLEMRLEAAPKPLLPDDDDDVPSLSAAVSICGYVVS